MENFYFLLKKVVGFLEPIHYLLVRRGHLKVCLIKKIVFYRSNGVNRQILIIE